MACDGYATIFVAVCGCEFNNILSSNQTLSFKKKCCPAIYECITVATEIAESP